MYGKDLAISLSGTRGQLPVCLQVRKFAGAFTTLDYAELKSKPFVCTIQGLVYAKGGMVNVSIFTILKRWLFAQNFLEGLAQIRHAA